MLSATRRLILRLTFFFGIPSLLAISACGTWAEGGFKLEAQRPQHRPYASFCLVGADPGWMDCLILLGSPATGEGLL